MKQRIWAAKFMDGTISVKADIAVSYPDLLDARREYELLRKYANSTATDDEKIEFNHITDEYFKTFHDVFRYKEKIPEKYAPVSCYLTGALTRNNLAKNLKRSIFRGVHADYICNEASANALLSVRLGESQLFKMNVFDKKNTVIEGFYLYRFHPFEQRRFVVEQSLIDIGLTKKNLPSKYALFYKNIKTNDIVLTSDALNCTVDIWQDPIVESMLFLTDTLKEKLEEAGVAKTWKLIECKIQA
ncbi:hypothetical protein VQ643_07805 [Pseudomonas sp. F1_0610]|uniref:hypothetical protein n=1 Tax=Pseudomonas sp. F1_0610 TaxID=3114284 RepID=UPI0039C412C6